MSITSISVFEHTLQKTDQWLEALAANPALDDSEQAYSALRAVLHAVRDRLPVEEASDLASQLPMLVRGFYYEGWNPSLAPNKQRDSEQFLNQVRQSLRTNTQIDPAQATGAVIKLLQQNISAGQMAHVRQAMPESIVEQLWPE